MFEVIVVTATKVEIAVSVSYSVYVLTDVAADMLMDALTDMILGVLPAIGVDVLMDVNVNAVAGAITVEFAMPAPLEAFNCSAAFDCRPMTALDRNRVLQAWIPSYHV